MVLKKSGTTGAGTLLFSQSQAHSTVARAAAADLRRPTTTIGGIDKNRTLGRFGAHPRLGMYV